MTIQQRNQIYKKAYELLSESYNFLGICFSIDKVCNENGKVYYKNYGPFIEMYLLRPTPCPTYWFYYDEKGKENRLTILAFCIAMTEE